MAAIRGLTCAVVGMICVSPVAGGGTISNHTEPSFAGSVVLPSLINTVDMFMKVALEPLKFSGASTTLGHLDFDGSTSSVELREHLFSHVSRRPPANPTAPC